MAFRVGILRIYCQVTLCNYPIPVRGWGWGGGRRRKDNEKKNAVNIRCKRSSFMALEEVMQFQIRAARSVFGMTAVKCNVNRLSRIR